MALAIARTARWMRRQRRLKPSLSERLTAVNVERKTTRTRSFASTAGRSYEPPHSIFHFSFFTFNCPGRERSERSGEHARSERHRRPALAGAGAAERDSERTRGA